MHQFIYLYIAFLIGVQFLPERKATERLQDVEAIETAVREGSSKDLSRFFSHSISLHLNNIQGDYSKNQAQLILRDFFKNTPPQAFNIVQQGKSTDKIWYAIGEYRNNTDFFKVLIKGTQDKKTLLIYSLEFKRE